MKLSDLIQFLNYLDQVDLSDCYTKSFDNCSNLEKMIVNAKILDKSFKEPVIDSLLLVDQSLQQFIKSIRELRQKIMFEILKLEKKYFIESSTLFTNSYCNDDARHIISRKISLSAEAATILEQRLKIHTSWQHPGLILRPLHLSALHELVALDPLYVADTHEELLEHTTNQFTELYQHRVRTYVINDRADDGIFEQLPTNQFGLIAAQNFFTFKPIEIVNNFISESFNLLKPGGALVFTYNNCDYAGAVKLVENHFGCYLPGRLIKQHAASVGFVLNYEYNEINGVSILELGKPGYRASIRGGQSLAVIKDSTVEVPNNRPVKTFKKSKIAKHVDTGVTKLYTDEDKQRVRLSAVVLGIDTEHNVSKNYSIEELDQLVADRLNTRDFNHEKFQKRLDKLINQRKTT